MRRSLPPLAALGLLGAALFFGGAAGTGSLPWIGTAALVLAAAVLPSPRLTRGGWAAVALLAAFVAWCGVSTVWSWLPDRSWEYLNRGLVYGAFLLLGLAVAGRAREVALGLAALLGLVVAWSLAGKVVPWLGGGGRIARLRDPVGIWNELALLGDIALPLGLWIATEVRRRAGLLLVYGWTVAILLTLSRGGAIVAVLVCALWIALASRRFESLVSLVVAGLPGAVVAGIAFALPGVTSDGEPHSTRVRDGLVFGLLLLAGAALVALVPELAPEERRRRLVRRALVVSGALAAVVLLAVTATHASSWWDEFRNPASAEASNDPGRFASASSNNRWRWWGEAVDGWRLQKLEGTGAGSFEVVHKRFRDNDQAVTEPHNLPVQFLGETGIVGLLLWAGAFAAALAALFRRPPRAARLALALAPVAFLLHGLLEIDWDFLAVCAPVFLALGTALGGDAPRAPATWRLGAGALAVAGAVSLFSPWLADRYVSRAYDHLGTRRAVHDADRARSLDPLSLEPLLARANARLALRDLRGAYADHLAEIDEQPENPDAWCDVGQFELDVLDAPSQAYEHLNRWYTLDSQGPCLDLLDRARRAVNAGG